MRQLSLVAVSGGCSLIAVGWLLLLLSIGSRRTGSAAVALQLWGADSAVVHIDLVASQHVGSSRSRDRTRVPCIGRWILNRWTTWEALTFSFLI